jgi:hypothetical protein
MDKARYGSEEEQALDDEDTWDNLLGSANAEEDDGENYRTATGHLLLH